MERTGRPETVGFAGVLRKLLFVGLFEELLPNRETLSLLLVGLLVVREGVLMKLVFVGFCAGVFVAVLRKLLLVVRAGVGVGLAGAFTTLVFVDEP